MGELRIDLIKNENLRQVANAADLDGNQKVDKEDEIFMFNALLEQSYNSEAKTAFEAMGLELSATTETEEAEGAEEKKDASAAKETAKQVKSKPLSKKETKQYQKDLNKDIERLLEDCDTSDKLVAELRNLYKDSSTSGLIDEVEYVASLVNATGYNSKKDVESIKDTVEAQLKAAGKNDKFHKNILKSLVKQAKSIQITKEAEPLFARYEEIKAEEGDGKEFGKYLDKVKKELKDSKKWDSSYTKDAFELLEDAFNDDADQYGRNLTRTAEGESKKEVMNDVKSQITDKKTRKYYEKNFKKDAEIKARENKVYNRQEELENISKEDIIKYVGEDTYRRLKQKFLADTLEDGQPNPRVLGDDKYDLSDITNMVIDYVGKNFKMDRNDSDKMMSELHNLTAYLKTQLGENLSEQDVKDIVKMTEVVVEGKDRNVLHALNKALWGIPGAVGAGAGAATAAIFKGRSDVIHYFARPINIDVNIDVTSIVNLNGSGVEAVADKLTSVLEEGMGLKIVATANDHITVQVPPEWDSTVLIDHRNDYAQKTGAGAALGALAISIATTALLSLTFGEPRDEKSCSSVSNYDKDKEEYTNPEKYKKLFANTTDNKNKIRLFNALVDLYVDKYGDNWHVELQNYIRKSAGIGSKLNQEECYRAFRYPEPISITEDCLDEYEITTKEVPESTQTVQTEEKAGEYINKDNYQWADLARMYSCLDGKSVEYKARFMKVLQGIDDGNYDFERLDRLTKQSLQKGKNYSIVNEPGFNADRYSSAMTTTTRVGDKDKRIIAPDELGGGCKKDLTRLGDPTKVTRSGGRAVGPTADNNASYTVTKTVTTPGSYSWKATNKCDNRVVGSGTDKASEAKFREENAGKIKK